MNKAEKQQYIENLDQMSKDYSAVFVASFSKMSVKEMIEFRTEIRNNDGFKGSVSSLTLDSNLPLSSGKYVIPSSAPAFESC